MPHWTYKSIDAEGEKGKDILKQGDVLKLTPNLYEVIGRYHPYYIKNTENLYYLIISQSCDLIRRKGKHCKAKYISLAAVRPFSYLIKNIVEEMKDPDVSIRYRICSKKTKEEIRKYLERLLNNNEIEYFYLHKEPSMAFPEDCCAYLRLTISIKSKDHYETCLKARILGLDDSFRDKLGWQVGQLYSRVGTPDWDPKLLENEIDIKLKDIAVWVDEWRLGHLKKSISEWCDLNPGKEPDLNNIGEMISNAPQRKDELLDRIGEIIEASTTIKDFFPDKSIPESFTKRIKHILRQDTTISAYLG